MIPEQQRIALAEWAGWLVISNTLCNVKPDKNGNPELEPVAPLPDYLNDLNAVHELEKKLNFEQAEQFEDELCDIVVAHNEQQENPAPWRFAVVHATADQRCEALLKTLNLWKQP